MDTASESYCFREKNTLESKLSNGEVSLEKDFEQSKSRSNLKIARSRTISPPPLPQWTSSLTGHSWEYFINTRPVSRKIQLVCSSVRLLLPINAQHRQSVGSQAKTFGNAGWFVGKFAVPLEGGGEKKGRKKLQQRAWKSGDACWFFCWKKYLPKRRLFISLLPFSSFSKASKRRDGTGVISLEHRQPSRFLDACVSRFSVKGYLRCFQVSTSWKFVNLELTTSIRRTSVESWNHLVIKTSGTSKFWILNVWKCRRHNKSVTCRWTVYNCSWIFEINI